MLPSALAAALVLAPPVAGADGPGDARGGDPVAAADTDPVTASVATWRALFALQVPRCLAVPPDEQQRYAVLAQQALQAAATLLVQPQFLLVVDRADRSQVVLLYVARPVPQVWHWIGATPVATGRPGSFDHFLTPLGVFLHGPANPDFRAEGTRNEFGIRGYGLKGRRVYDFGWVTGERTWGRGGLGTMRLQMHATDPDLLEPHLGQRGSKGCVRIPAALNHFIDTNGVLDAEYDAAQAAGARFWVFDRPPLPNPLAGRWMVVVDSARSSRPDWAAPPPAAGRAPLLAAGASGSVC